MVEGMIIRSQNREVIINFDRVDTVCLGGIEGKSVITFTNAQVVTLGTYSTEEKAIKVLDMICNSCRNTAFIDEVSVVFEMPQDCEV